MRYPDFKYIQLFEYDLDYHGYQRDLLFTMEEAKNFNIHINARPIAFIWESSSVRRGLYVGAPWCPEHIKYVRWWANKELHDLDYHLVNHSDGTSESEEFWRIRAAQAKRLIFEADHFNWVDTECHELCPSEEAYKAHLYMTHPERLRRTKWAVAQ